MLKNLWLCFLLIQCSYRGGSQGVLLFVCLFVCFDVYYDDPVYLTTATVRETAAAGVTFRIDTWQ